MRTPTEYSNLAFRSSLAACVCFALAGIVGAHGVGTVFDAIMLMGGVYFALASLESHYVSRYNRRLEEAIKEKEDESE